MIRGNHIDFNLLFKCFIFQTIRPKNIRESTRNFDYKNTKTLRRKNYKNNKKIRENLYIKSNSNTVN